MPEGDTLFRIAATLAPVLVGARVVRFESHVPTISEAVLARAPLVGRTVASVEPRGQTLLVAFDDGRVLHTHLRMKGSWHLYRPGDRWKLPAALARVVLEVDAGAVAVCFGAPVVRLLSSREIRRDEMLVGLGPDYLAPELDTAAARARLRALADRPLGEALLVQSAISGMGNVYKSEVLFLRALDPFATVAAYTDAELDELIAEGRRLMESNVAAIRNEGARDAPFRAAPDPFRLRGRTTRRGQGPERLWVYGRSGLPCFTCGEAIAMRRQGALGRSTYFCSRCQPARA